jgi:hypothetical protein
MRIFDMFNMMEAVTGMMGGKMDASTLQSVMGMVQGHMAENNGQAGDTNPLATMVAEKMGMNAGMVQAFMPQLMQVVQNGALQQLLDRNQDNQVDMADLMSLIQK